MRSDVQGFCKFKVASRIDIFILQKTKKHISLKKRFGRQCFIIRTAQACKTLGASLANTDDMEESDELYLLRYRYGRTAEAFVAYETFLYREVHSGPGKRCHNEDVIKNVTHTLLVTFYSFIYSLFDKSGTDFISTTEPYKDILTEDGKKFRNELIDMWNENKTSITKLRHNVGFHGGTKLKSHEVGYGAFSEIHPQTPELIMSYFAIFLMELDKVVPPSQRILDGDADPDKMKKFMVEHSERLKEKLGDPYWQALKKFMEEFNNFI